MLSSLRQVYLSRGPWSSLGGAGSSALRQFSRTNEEANGIHSDFQPQYKTQPGSSVDEQIQKDIADNKVFLYMKGDPDAPMCGFSNMACKILHAYGVDFGSRDVLSDPDLREGIKKFSNWPTIPQVYVNGEFVGGSDILMGLHKNGELEALFKNAGS